MFIKTSELIGPALDWAVAKCLGVHPVYLIGKDFLSHQDQGNMCYSFDWSQGGPIIERKGFWLKQFVADDPKNTRWEAISGWFPAHITCSGTTPLIAAMRCFVALKLGDEVEIPEELL